MSEEDSKENITNRLRWKNRRRMAWTALISMLIVTLMAFFVIPDTKLTLLSEVITWFYFSMASVIGAYMGFTTWASK